ncbi:MAG: hypothetical protein AMXMBFR46_01410 [Acidimicrobiia bacterium]
MTGPTKDRTTAARAGSTAGSTAGPTAGPTAGSRTGSRAASERGPAAANDTRSSSRAGATEIAGINLAVLWGRCSTGVDVRTLAAGRRLASLAVRTPGGGGHALRAHRRGTAATSVPVTVWDPPAWLEEVAADDLLVVVGAVRRRFFTTRSGGRGAKAEVEALTIARATPAQLARARRRAEGALGALDGSA